MTTRSKILGAAVLAVAGAISVAAPSIASADSAYLEGRYVPGPPSGAIDFPEAGSYVPGSYTPGRHIYYYAPAPGASGLVND